MAFGHMNLKRILHRTCEEFCATYEIAKITSIKKAIITFFAKLDIQIMNRNGYKEPSAVRERLIKKHEIMLEYFEKRFGGFYKNYDYEKTSTNASSELCDRIWMCWWQGEENAPPLVKRCIESVKRSAGDRTVTVITEENFREFADIPDWIIKKFNDGIITRTNLSDLLRISLLAQHGGMWLDATFFCTEKADLDEYFKYPLWSIKRPDYLHCSIASGYFAGYSLQCSRENRYIFSVIRDFFLHYWEHTDMLIDYLLVDYMIVLAQKHDKRISEAFKEIVPNNQNCDELFKVLGCAYDEEKWKALSDNTYLFKLSWKQAFPTEVKGSQTFYSKLINKEL